MFVKDSENKNDIKNALLNINKTTYPQIIELASSIIDNMNISGYNKNSIKKSQIIDAIDIPKEKLISLNLISFFIYKVLYLSNSSLVSVNCLSQL